MQNFVIAWEVLYEGIMAADVSFFSGFFFLYKLIWARRDFRDDWVRIADSIYQVPAEILLKRTSVPNKCKEVCVPFFPLPFGELWCI